MKLFRVVFLLLLIPFLGLGQDAEEIIKALEGSRDSLKLKMEGVNILNPAQVQEYNEVLKWYSFNIYQYKNGTKVRVCYLDALKQETVFPCEQFTNIPSAKDTTLIRPRPITYGAFMNWRINTLRENN